MDSNADSTLLQGIKIVSLALNVPGPAAAARLAKLGADVTKVEPPTGDAIKTAAPGLYESLCQRQTVLRLDLKSPDGRAKLDDLLMQADLLLASFRPSALQRLELDWESLHARHPKLCFVGIIGYPAPLQERTGHDLTYQSDLGLLRPPQMPSTLFVDLAGAERAVSMALAVLNRTARGGGAGCAWVSLYECARDLAAPLQGRPYVVRRTVGRRLSTLWVLSGERWMDCDCGAGATFRGTTAEGTWLEESGPNSA